MPQIAKEAVLERTEIDQENKWNVEALYKNLDEWEKEFLTVSSSSQPRWPELASYKGSLGSSPENLKEFFEKSVAVERKLSKLYTYAHLRHDEDIAEEKASTAYKKISSLYQDLQQELAWMEPELLALPDETIKAYLGSPVLADWHIHLERMVRMKPHTLSEENEQLMALAGKALVTPSRAFSALNNADLKFPNAVNANGEEKEVSHAKYLTYVRSKDRALRKSAFESMHGSYKGHENTLCELLAGQVQAHILNARARGFNSSLEAALFPHQVDPAVYKELIKATRAKLPVLHKYLELRKKLLGVDKLHMWDLHVPLVQDVEMKFAYGDAEDIVIKSVSPLGNDYKTALEEGLKKGRWVDRYENARKRSGAYSSGCYDSMPYILMNYQGNFHDLMTLAHEAGHSMHSFHSNKNQDYQYSHYPIFVAEVASTFNEELVFHDFMEKEKDPIKRRFLINQKLEDIRSTFFRQVMFAEFELKIHELAEQDVPLTPQLLCDEYYKLNQDYFGPVVEVDELIAIEWARIPHFYYNFYVYQYATGISAAHFLFDRVMNKGGKDDYLTFLSSGSSDFPLQLLKKAGVDMHEGDAVNSLLDQFDQLVDELGK